MTQAPGNWSEQIRQQVAAQRFSAALAIADARLVQAPQDLEARGWRARLLAWSGDWPAAEAEYRRVLEKAAEDADILAGLAAVLSRGQRFEEAAALLTRAVAVAPNRGDLLLARARVRETLGQTAAAWEDFRAALALDPNNAEAKAGLASLAPEPRHEIRIGSDTDFFNFADAAGTQTISLRLRWSSHWSTAFAGSFYERFGADAGKFAASLTRRLGARDALTAGGAFARDAGIIPKREAFIEYGHGFHLSEQGFFRAVETSYTQRWLWFAGAQIWTLAGSATVYLPREWTWSLSVTAARSQFASSGAAWTPSGLTRLSFPVRRRLGANVFYSVGTENFAQVDQIGRFSARTFGGGARLQVTGRQDVTGYFAYQNRSQGRTQTSFGLNYGLRF